MSSTRRRRQKPSQARSLTRSLSPECYIDLTVDSPVRTPIETRILDHEAESTMMISQLQRALIWPLGTVSRRAVNREESPESNTHRLSIEIDTPDVELDIELNDNNNFRENTTNETVVIDDPEPVPVVSMKNSSQVHEKSTAPCLSCPICFEELLNTSIPAYTTKCGHIFCETCLKRAIETRKKCPMCLKAVNIKQCVRLHI
ncbi:E3 ubiquitin-protein ligase BRE1-like [Chelonus insularis]|uniref:E3 ubiquitin-protein ligase BRE1-like n=1 Tax=Chelonus insularis TaxID=460826 RepID=UPI00158ADD5D|nr:E3 ubiquitin-protein ligase BRE1-like [Chelonus insularis]XP_034949691.1 E3 ubiquitin-protein ligase BRE1-like [Chelonus insularis]